MLLMQKLQRDPAPNPVAIPGGAPMAMAPPGGAIQMTQPSQYITLKGMFNPANAANDPTFFDDIQADVTEECQKHGGVTKCWVDRNDPNGKVWVRFADLNSAAS